MTGVLYVVATPLGNLDDISVRAIRTLQQVSCIAAEDTRHTGKLLQHLNVATPAVALHEHNEAARVEAFIQRLQAGEDIALVSDAGTPLISDPGYRLVTAAQAAGISVSPVPGPCAAIAALSAAGLPSDRFIFEGFLPARASARQTRLRELAEETRTLIFYEAPHRILECLQDMQLVWGDTRRAVLARELTKAFETVRQRPLAELLAWVAADSNQQRGEIVLLVEGAPARSGEPEQGEVDALLGKLLRHVSVKQAAQIAAELTGLKKNSLYDRALQLQA